MGAVHRRTSAMGVVDCQCKKKIKKKIKSILLHCTVFYQEKAFMKYFQEKSSILLLFAYKADQRNQDATFAIRLQKFHRC